MSRNKVLLALVLGAPLSGCADYLNYYDGVTLAAGDTQKQNMLLQTANPFNPDSQNVAISATRLAWESPTARTGIIEG